MEKKESGPNSLIVFICLILAIVVLSGKFEAKDNKELNATFKQTETSQSSTLQISDADFNNLTMLVLAEAASQPHDGKVAVAATVLNRLEKNYGSSIYDVIFAPGQFSCCYNGYFCHADGVPLSFSNYSEETLQDAMSAVEEALAGKDPTEEALGGGCLYYYNPDYTPDDELALRANLSRTFRIGDHVFYREWN
ncbi:MAG: cell wall hydrolase [Clostridia bacterium]|nr:cell wall hydrolase [Clostridia bacterium]